jgi:Flp pilus assembly pilin Flp
MTLTETTAKSKTLLTKLYKEEEGGELLEYALIAGLIVIAAIAAIKLFSGALTSKFKDMEKAVKDAGK